MSYDFRYGLQPDGTLDSAASQLRGFPYRIVVDHVSADIDAALAGSKYFWVQGTGDMRRVPHSITALAFAATWDFDISLDGDGGAMTWTGTLKRGISSNNGTETGTQLTSQFDAFSRGIVLPATVATYREQRMRYEVSDTSDTPETFLVLQFDVDVVTYVVADDTWYVGSLFTAATFTSPDTTVVSSGGSGDPTTGLTICGDTWNLIGNDVTAFSGTITPATWLT